MQCLVSPDKKIAKIWGIPKNLESEYRLSYFVLEIKTPDGILLYNTVTGELIILDQLSEMEVFLQLPKQYEPQMQTLVEKHYIVPSDYEEYMSVLQLREILARLDRKNYIDNVVILPTTCCNARCFYCYESNYRHVNMTDEIVNKTIDFLIKNYSGLPYHFTWFGGEPLLGNKQIDAISSALDEHNIPFDAIMITNGFMFDEQLAQKAKQIWKLRKVQITLDGTEDIYNQTKSYVSVCKSPFRQVLRNIRYLLDNGIHVAIRLNVGLHNVNDVENLIQLLLTELSEYSDYNIYLHKLFDNKGFIPVQHSAEDVNLLLEKIVELERKIENTNIFKNRYGLPRLITTRCMADAENSLLIDPEGFLYKCEHINQDDCIGHIDTGITNQEAVDKWRKATFSEKCKKCALFPKCKNLVFCEDHEECVDILVDWKRGIYQKSILEYYKRVKQ